jgi:hypothetical protein
MHHAYGFDTGFAAPRFRQRGMLSIIALNERRPFVIRCKTARRQSRENIDYANQQVSGFLALAMI